jgi:purine-nucleoside phosphorylase
MSGREPRAGRRADALADAAAAIRTQWRRTPQCAIVLGSGLGGLAGEIDRDVVVPYRAIPHFPIPKIAGHAGELVLGRLDGRPVAALAGRAHLYEGYTAAEVVFPIRTLAALGAPVLILSNAAGGLHPEFRRGDLMVLTDHLNLTGTNPLVGPNDERIGPRFPDMSAVYDPELRRVAEAAARGQGIVLRTGVYAGVLGPSYETPAEVRMLRGLGADAVGMSTVLEAIAARHAGMRVVGIAAITNVIAGHDGAPSRRPARSAADGPGTRAPGGPPVEGLGPHDRGVAHEDVLAVAAAIGPRFAALVRRIVRESGASSDATGVPPGGRGSARQSRAAGDAAGARIPRARVPRQTRRDA